MATPPTILRSAAILRCCVRCPKSENLGDGRPTIPGRHSMTVLKRGKTTNWFIQFQLNGQTYIRSTKTPDRKVAERMEAEWRAKLHAQQVLGVREQIRLLDAMDLFIATKAGRPNHANLAYSRVVLEKHLSHRAWLNDLTSEDLERFKQIRQAEQIAPQTIRHQLNLIRGTVKHANRLRYNVPALEYPKVQLTKHRLRFLSMEEEARLLKALDPHRSSRGLKQARIADDEITRALQDAYDIVVILLDTGARYSEIANLEWARLDLTGREIRLWRSKVENESVLYMTDRVHRLLSRRMTDPVPRYLFQNRRGGPRGYAAQSIRKAFKRAGLNDCSIHTLRHTHATRLIQNGMSIYEVKAILGHTDIKTTLRYAHLEQTHVSLRARDVINSLHQ